MRAVFGLLGLVLVLAVVGVLAKKSWQSSQDGLPRQTQTMPAEYKQTPGAQTVHEHGQQVSQQYRHQLESALSAQRPEPEQAP